MVIVTKNLEPRVTLKGDQNTAHLKVFENCSICHKPIGATHIQNHEKSCRKEFTNTIEKHYVSNGDFAEMTIFMYSM